MVRYGELAAGAQVAYSDRDTQLWTGVATKYGVLVVTAGAFEFWYRRRAWVQDTTGYKLKEPGEVHRDLRVMAPVTGVSIALDPAVVARAAAALDLPGPPHLGRVVGDARDGLTARALAVAHHLAAPVPDAFAADTAVAELADALVRAHAERVRPPRRIPLPLRRVRDYLEANLAEPVAIGALARAVGLDPFQLARAFRAELGLPPYAYLTHLRVARARDLLATGTPPAEAAAAVGFCDQSQLNRHFTRRLGVTPGRYARQSRGRRRA
jgi:AraC-like DNA-binding protein